jgi:lipopolysaccharide export system protein LptA
VTGPLLALLLSAEGPTAQAAPEPVRVEAAEVRYAWGARTVTFTGKPLVTLTRGDATLTCRRLLAENDEAGTIRRATCEGEVRLVRGQRVVTCERAVYEHAAARVTCQGNPVLRDGGAEARGDALVYDLAEDAVSLQGARVTVPGDRLELERRKAAGGGP